MLQVTAIFFLILAHVFDETFGVNSAFNAKLFVAAPHPVAM